MSDDKVRAEAREEEKTEEQWWEDRPRSRR